MTMITLAGLAREVDEFLRFLNALWVIRIKQRNTC